ncbi:MAG: 1-acyl-sn-glycerol-3-phosphate acyltransferase [Candidatus Omnitrophica bacterium]|nr:1-acyl-sn-glycerol-3-phosphate acyltransferase [Candidatus Omnitrophota bacterium]
MWYFIGWLFFLIVFKLYLGVKVVGRENVPAKGAFIFASNHTSYLDPILLGISIYRSLNYMAREDLFKEGFLGWALPKVQAFPVRRGEGDVGALRQALRLLKTNKGLVIFPEGTRSEDAQLKRAKPGIGFIAAKSGVPVIPAYIEGSFEALPRGVKTLKRHPVKIYIGRPLHFADDVSNKNDRLVYQKISDEIMSAIADLKYECERSSASDAQKRFEKVVTG